MCVKVLYKDFELTKLLEEMHDPVLSQPICQVGSEPPLLSSEKNFVHGHFCYWYNVAQYCQCHIRAEVAHYSRRKPI